MWTDIKTAVKILRKFVRTGKELTYRERRQLRRVVLDILRFVPMLVIILIPFLEALLPVILMIFPNMLPSRFQTEHMKLEKQKKVLTARIGLATFFQDTLTEFVKETEHKKEKEVRSLAKLLDKIKSGEEIKNTSILKVASLFDDEMALDNATHTVLSNMCRYMQINNFGTTPMLRTRLYAKIRAIRREDQGIRKEGLENIPEPLLKQLLRERGMRSDFQEWVLRANMSKWLELSLDHEVPVTLLVMSRIFTLQHIPGQDATSKLKETISTIGDATTQEMLVEKGGVEDKLKEKEIIERQQQLIDEEETLKMEMSQSEDSSESDKSLSEDKERRMIRDVAESVESLTTESPVDHEKLEIQEIKEKIQEITKDTQTVEEMEEEDTILAEDVLTAKEVEAVEVPTKEEKRAQIELEFEVREDTIDFVDDEEKGIQEEMDRETVLKEIAGREKTKQKLSKRIEKSLEKTSKKVDETSSAFANTLKSIDNLDQMSEHEFIALLQEVVKLEYSEDQYREFWKLYKAKREKKPEAEAWMVLEHIIDDHEDDIDMKDIKGKTE